MEKRFNISDLFVGEYNKYDPCTDCFETDGTRRIVLRRNGYKRPFFRDFITSQEMEIDYDSWYKSFITSEEYPLPLLKNVQSIEDFCTEEEKRKGKISEQRILDISIYLNQNSTRSDE